MRYKVPRRRISPPATGGRCGRFFALGAIVLTRGLYWLYIRAMVETYNKLTIVKWKPSELLKVQGFCAERGLEFSTLVRQVMLYVQAQPAAFASFAAAYLDSKTVTALKSAELGLEWDLPQPTKKPALKAKPRRRRAKRGRPT